MQTETLDTPLDVRPGLDTLRRCATLCHVDDVWGRIELKLETPDTRYWLTTEGLPEKSRTAPPNFVVNYVTIEKRTTEGRWDLTAVFSPDAWKLSQAFDYCQLLYRDLRELNERIEKHFSWELKRQIDEVWEELQRTNKTVYLLSEKVRGDSN